MKKNTLVILNFGFLLIILSAVGADMEINYFVLVSGLVLVGIGAIRLFFGRKK